MKKKKYIITMILLVVLCLGVQFTLKGTELSDYVSTALSVMAAVTCWLEFRSSERVNEAQLIMELNDQFITNPQFNEVEMKLERYYEKYVKAQQSGEPIGSIPFDINLDEINKERQGLINYLVHLEGVAALVNEEVLHLDAITDLMAYRYFIAVNNPHVQKKELLPYQDYYRGCFRIYDNWSKKLGADKVPMADHALVKGSTRKS